MLAIVGCSHVAVDTGGKGSPRPRIQLQKCGLRRRPFRWVLRKEIKCGKHARDASVRVCPRASESSSGPRSRRLCTIVINRQLQANGPAVYFPPFFSLPCQLLAFSLRVLGMPGQHASSPAPPVASALTIEPAPIDVVSDKTQENTNKG